MAKQELGFVAPPSLAIAAGAITPNPGVAGVQVWSTTLAALVSWNGTSWNAAAGGGSSGGPIASGRIEIDFGRANNPIAIQPTVDVTYATLPAGITNISHFSKMTETSTTIVGVCPSTSGAQGVFKFVKSIDKGKTWTEVVTNLLNQPSVMWGHWNAGQLRCVSGGNVMKSTDNAETWTVLAPAEAAWRATEYFPTLGIGHRLSADATLVYNGFSDVTATSSGGATSISYAGGKALWLASGNAPKYSTSDASLHLTEPMAFPNGEVRSISLTPSAVYNMGGGIFRFVVVSNGKPDVATMDSNSMGVWAIRAHDLGAGSYLDVITHDGDKFVGYGQGLSWFATSPDGLVWTKTELGYVPFAGGLVLRSFNKLSLISTRANPNADSNKILVINRNPDIVTEDNRVLVAQKVITGIPGILATSKVKVWLQPIGTADHSEDEHRIDPPRISSGNIVAGTGFTIYADAPENTYSKWYGLYTVAYEVTN